MGSIPWAGQEMARFSNSKYYACNKHILNILFISAM